MINSVIVIGHLGQDPEVKYNDDGTPIARFSVACNEVWSNNGKYWGRVLKLELWLIFSLKRSIDEKCQEVYEYEFPMESIM